MTDDDLYALYERTMESYKAYIGATSKVSAARKMWLGYQAQLSEAASPDEVRAMLLRRLLKNGKGRRRRAT
jgi:hypothetical protein